MNIRSHEMRFGWTRFYEAVADKLLLFRNRRDKLIAGIHAIASELDGLSYLMQDQFADGSAGPLKDICPFTAMGTFNRRLSPANRKAIAQKLADFLEISEPAVPDSFEGVPILNNQNSWFFRHEKNRQPDDIDTLWEIFDQAIAFAKSDNAGTRSSFVTAYDNATQCSGVGWNLTIGLYWIRPWNFPTLDSQARPYISEKLNIQIGKNNPKGYCNAIDYLEVLDTLKAHFQEGAYPTHSFPELSFEVYGGKPPIKIIDSGVISEKNIILYGPPGTGKTYSSIQYAVAIIDEKSLDDIRDEKYEDVIRRYHELKADGLIAFTTFHQSFSYEEFIEGIRPVLSSDERSESGRDIEYEVSDGIFKAFCDKAETPLPSGTSNDMGISKTPNIWKVSLERTGDNPTRAECMENDHIRIGWDAYGEFIADDNDYNRNGGKNVLNAFYNGMKIGDIVMSCYSSRTVDAIGVITGEPEWRNEYPKYKRLRKVKWLVKGIDKDIIDFNGGRTLTLSTIYQLSLSMSDVLQILQDTIPQFFAHAGKVLKRVFIIDEINRGNISKIFGELITLVEPNKRIGEAEELRARLPYSKKDFGVPSNVYIIGTMNSADRSTAMIDTALRRRFSFVEMPPDPALLQGITVENIDIAEMLDTINRRITVLLDREHVIGHSYLFGLRDDTTIKNLAGIFENKIFPLLQEYFYDNYEKIQLVLGDNQKSGDDVRFVVKKSDADVVKLFGNAGIDYPQFYEVNRDAFDKIEAYAFLK